MVHLANHRSNSRWRAGLDTRFFRGFASTAPALGPAFGFGFGFGFGGRFGAGFGAGAGAGAACSFAVLFLTESALSRHIVHSLPFPAHSSLHVTQCMGAGGGRGGAAGRDST